MGGPFYRYIRSGSVEPPRSGDWASGRRGKVAISRNLRRQRAKVRQQLAVTDAANTAAFVTKQELIRQNCKTMGKAANRMGTGRISWLDPSAKPAGFTRPWIYSKGVAPTK